MSHVKAGGKTRQHSQRAGKRLGVKVYGGQAIKTGMIIVRQRGTRYHPAEGVDMGRDHTLYAIKDGTVQFKIKNSRQLVTVA
jgi:large subunit ribosomal protein L27